MYELQFDQNNATVRFITKIHHDFTQTMARTNVWGTFRALAVEFDRRRELCWLLFDEVRMRKSAGFDELWSVDFRLDQVSGRRRTTRFRSSNKAEYIDLPSVPLCSTHHGPGYLPLSGNIKSGVWRRAGYGFMPFAFSDILCRT
jgi:hypothetical protein